MGPLIDSPCTSVSCPTCLLILNLPLRKFTSLQGSATFTKTSLTAPHSTALNTLQPILLPFLHTCMHKKCMGRCFAKPSKWRTRNANPQRPFGALYKSTAAHNNTSLREILSSEIEHTWLWRLGCFWPGLTWQRLCWGIDAVEWEITLKAS